MKNTTEKFHKKVYQIPDRAKTEARPCEAEARPSQLKNCRPPRAEADASRTPSLIISKENLARQRAKREQETQLSLHDKPRDAFNGQSRSHNDQTGCHSIC